MKTVVVITNNPTAFKFFLTQLNFQIGQSFSFVMVDTPEKLIGLKPAIYTRLSMEALHLDAEEIAYKLNCHKVPHFDSYDFTKDSQEIIKYANES